MENDIERFGNSLNTIIEDVKAKFNQLIDLQSLWGNIKNTYLFKCDEQDNKNGGAGIIYEQCILGNKRASIPEKLNESEEDAAKRFDKILSKTNKFTKQNKDEVNLPLKESEDKPIFVGLSNAENIIPHNHPRINSPLNLRSRRKKENDNTCSNSVTSAFLEEMDSNSKKNNISTKNSNKAKKNTVPEIPKMQTSIDLTNENLDEKKCNKKNKGKKCLKKTDE
jgi:hypothetical protein